MFKIGDILVFKRDVCKVVDIKLKAFNSMDYYVLSTLYDKSLKIEIPTDNANIRSLITKKKAKEIISKIAEIKQIETPEIKFKAVESKYRDLLNSGNFEDLIIIIKTVYLKNQEKIDNKKSTSNVDNNYSKLAEQYLYNEFAVVLGMSYQATKEYIMDYIIG